MPLGVSLVGAQQPLEALKYDNTHQSSGYIHQLDSVSTAHSLNMLRFLIGKLLTPELSWAAAWELKLKGHDLTSPHICYGFPFFFGEGSRFSEKPQ